VFQRLKNLLAPGANVWAAYLALSILAHAYIEASVIILGLTTVFFGQSVQKNFWSSVKWYGSIACLCTLAFILENPLPLLPLVAFSAYITGKKLYPEAQAEVYKEILKHSQRGN